MFKRPVGYSALLSLFFLSVMFLTRVVLLLMVPAGSGLTLGLILKSFMIGLVFDLGTLSYCLIPVALYCLLVPKRLATHWIQDYAALVFAATVVAVLLFNGVSEYLFFDEFGTRFNFIAIDYLIYTREVVGNIRESYPLPLIFTMLGLATAAVVWPTKQRIISASRHTFSQTRFRRTAALILLTPLLTAATLNISQTTTGPNNYSNELSANGIYALVAAFRNNELSYRQFYRTGDEQTVFARLQKRLGVPERSTAITRPITARGAQKRLNLIVVIEESMSGDFMQRFGNHEGITPNLDRLANESLFFDNLYASGTRTVRGLEALALSVPPLPGTSIVKRPGNDGFRSWGTVLKQHGYDTKYLYAGYGYFDNMNAFFSGNDYTVVDRSAFSKDEISFANIWGVCDEDLFKKTIKEADQSIAAGKPFFSMVMTTSNHRPFTYPAGAIDLPPGHGRAGGVKYADYAIGRLIEMAKKKPWFQDTLIVIVADHCAGSAGKTEIPVVNYHIPALVYAPAHIRPQVVSRLMGQIDLAPTVLGLMNVSYTSTFMGDDIFAPQTHEPRAVVSTYQKLGYLTDTNLVVFGPKKTSHQYTVDRASGHMVLAPDNPERLYDALAYFQGGEYAYRQRMNRKDYTSPK
mgnify:FL=1